MVSLALDRLAQDARYALRNVRRNPGFAFIAVATLALGIGANTAVFSVIDAVLLRKLPYSDPDRLVTLHQKLPKVGDITMGAAQAEYLDYRDRNRTFSSIAGYEDTAFDLTGEMRPERAQAELATYTLFSTLGVSPLVGRTFSAIEDRPGAQRVVVLSYEFWQRRFGGSPQALGQSIRLNEQPHTVIGVMPAGFEFPFTAASVGEPPALWAPIAFTPEQIRDRASEFPVQVVARLAPSVSLAQARQDVKRVADDFQKEHSDIYSGNEVLETSLDGLQTARTAPARPVLLTLAGAVFFVLLIACANVTNLLLARAAARQREMVLRNALGASAGRILAQLLTESLLLTLTGAMLGCALAGIVLRVAATLWPSFVAGLSQAHIDWTALGFTLAVSAMTGIVCGIAPAFGWVRGNAGVSLQQGGRPGTSHQRNRLRNVLVVAEASSAVVLLIAAGLLIHSFLEVLRVPIGFSPSGVLIARTTFNYHRYSSDDRRRAAERLMADRLAALPGVDQVALTTHIPLADERQIGFTLEGEGEHSSRWADNEVVSGGYFASMGIPLLRGRTFGPEDTPDAPQAAIVNEGMARRFWPDGEAVGQRILWGGRKLTIVGVVGDVHVRALDSAVNFTIYNSVYQIRSGAVAHAVFVIRTRSGSTAQIAPAVRQAIWSVDPEVPVFDIRTMDDIVSRSLAARRFAVDLLSCFALLALTLALIGLYSVLSYAVTQRTSEMGVRFALGATPGSVVRLILGDGLRLTTIGILLGGLMGASATRLMTRLLFGVRPLDPAAFVVAAASLLIVAMVAGFVPAWRASRVDPIAALRCE